MAVRPPRWLVAALTAIALSSGSVSAQKGPSVPDLLKLAGDYLSQYAQRLGAVAADEAYAQYDTSTGKLGTPKRVNAHVVWLGVADGAVEGFRDVVGIDSLPVRPKDERLLELFKTPTAASRTNARQMTEDAVRVYIDRNLHVLDEPTLALDFLRSANQERSTFKLEGIKTTNGARVAVLMFSEESAQRLLPSVENVPAIGRFWIDTASGAVRQTELGLGGRGFNVYTTVKYAADGATSLWLPVEMSQRCLVTGPGSSPINYMGANGGYNGRQELEARATYTNYRQVPVDLTKLR